MVALKRVLLAVTSLSVKRFNVREERKKKDSSFFVDRLHRTLMHQVEIVLVSKKKGTADMAIYRCLGCAWCLVPGVPGVPGRVSTQQEQEITQRSPHKETKEKVKTMTNRKQVPSSCGNAR